MNVDKEIIKQVGEKVESLRGRWCKIALYALIGALVGAGIITLTGCSGTLGFSVESQYGKLRWDFDGNGTPVIPQKK